MADIITTPSRRPTAQAQPKGPGGRLINGLLKFILFVILGLVGNILTEWLCMGWLWPEQGVGRSQAMLEAEVRYLEQDLKESILTEDPVQFAAQVADKLNFGLYRYTGLDQLAKVSSQRKESTRHPGSAQTQPLSKSWASMKGNLHDYLLAAIIATHVFALRISVLALSLPVFVLAGLIGAIDGMVQRDVNRWSGGRELGQRYHLAKGLVGPGLTWPWILYLAWPMTVHPYFIILPFALLFCFAVAMTTATFKKYF